MNRVFKNGEITGAQIIEFAKFFENLRNDIRILMNE